MPVANCTDEDVTYTIGGPGGDTGLKRRKYKEDTSIEPNLWVKFFDGEQLLAKVTIPAKVGREQVDPNNGNVIIALRKIDITFNAEVLEIDPDS